MKIFIPIKKNSNRVPNKNFRIFNGQPLYKHVISKWENKGFQIFVDTDSNEIIDDLKGFSYVTTYKRKKELEGDNVSVNMLVENFINNYFELEGDGIIAQIHVTNPFLSPETVIDASSYMNNFSSVFSVNKINSRLWYELDEKQYPLNHNPMLLEPTQDLKTIYEENSCFYIFNKNNFLKNNNRVSSKNKFYLVNFPENIDIDTEYDWDYAKKINTINL